MTQNILRKLMLIVVLLTSSHAFAHDFEKDGIYYNILSETDKTVEVTFKGSSYSEYYDEYSGSVIIPRSVIYNSNTYKVTNIGNKAFYYCSEMTSITIPNSVTNIDEGAFYYCCALTSITIPNTVTSINSHTFGYCFELISVIIPNSVESIGSYAFSNCWGVTSITLPNSVISIGDMAFQECTNLIEIISKNATPATAYNNTFLNIPTTATLYVPIDSKEAYANATGWKNVTTIIEIEMQEEHIVTIMDASNQGSLSIKHEAGKAFEFTVTPATGYIVNTVLVNGEEISSDNGDYKIESVNEETTISVSYEIDPATGVNTLNANNLKVYGYNETLTVTGTEYGDTISIYDLNGSMLKTQNSVGSTNNISLDNGIYIVKVSGKSFKVML